MKLRKKIDENIMLRKVWAGAAKAKVKLLAGVVIAGTAGIVYFNSGKVPDQTPSNPKITQAETADPTETNKPELQLEKNDDLIASVEPVISTTEPQATSTDTPIIVKKDKINESKDVPSSEDLFLDASNDYGIDLFCCCRPTATPSPSVAPSANPTETPTASPSLTPSANPTETSTASPSLTPSAKPTETPTVSPSAEPSANPTASPTESATVSPSVAPSANPTETPTASPSLTPSAKPTETPTASPSVAPSAKPTETATVSPSVAPSAKPTETATVSPSLTPSAKPTETASPSVAPSVKPTETASPSVAPSTTPSETPSPSAEPTPTASPAPTPTEPTYLLSVKKVGAGGGISIDGEEVEYTYSKEVKNGEYTLKASDEEFYYFIDWEDTDGNVLSYDNTYIVTIDGADKTVVARFSKVPMYLVKPTYTGMGSVTVNGSSEARVYGNDVVELTALSANGYQFMYWLDDDGNVISYFTTCNIFVRDNTQHPTAVFEKLYRLTVKKDNGGDVYSLSGEKEDFPETGWYTTDLVAGSYQFTALPDDNHVFDGWYDGNGKLLTTDTHLVFSMAGEDMTIHARFADKVTTVNVTYQHEDGTVLKSQATTFGEYLEAPTANVYRSDKTFDGWVLNDVLYKGEFNSQTFVADDGTTLYDAIKALTAVKEPVSIVSHYVPNPIVYYTVEISGGAISTVEVGSVTDDGVEAGSHIWVVANDAPEGYKFSHWENETGEVLSYESTKDFWVNGNMKLFAIYIEEEQPVEVLPTIVWGADAIVNSEAMAITYNWVCDIPSDYEKITWGILVTPDDLDEDELIVGSTAGRITNKTDSNPDRKASMLYNATFKKHFTIKARAYICVQKNGVTSYYYTSIITTEI